MGRRLRAVALLSLLGALGCDQPARKPKARSPEAKPGPVALASAPPKSPRAPKPGERVRQPELDGYCDADGALAFYYHGGTPSTRVARNDHCAPLFLSECEAEGRCYPPRDQEPGMWCCAPKADEQPAAHAAN